MAGLDIDSLESELRGIEEKERLWRLSTFENLSAGSSWHGSTADTPWTPDASLIRRLRRERHQLVSFHNAVWESRPWQAIQAIRRPLGRAWPQEVFVEDAAPLDDLATLTRDVQRLSAFRLAVLGSTSWRLTEALRAFLGRRW